MSCHVDVKYIRLPTSLLNNVGCTVDPSLSLLNFKPVITGVGVLLQLEILNIFKTALLYFYCDINMPFSNRWTSMPRKIFISPRSIISNSLSMTSLKSAMPKSLVNIKTSTYKQTMSILPCSFTLVYNVSSLSLLWNPFSVR